MTATGTVNGNERRKGNVKNAGIPEADQGLPKKANLFEMTMETVEVVMTEKKTESESKEKLTAVDVKISAESVLGQNQSLKTMKEKNRKYSTLEKNNNTTNFFVMLRRFLDRDRENVRERERDRDREREQRERERERERDRDRGRDRERERERDRDRDRERERDQDREVEMESRRNTIQPIVKTVVEEPSSSSEEELDKEEEQRRLEQEMIKRRERIERWRAERKLKELEINKKDLKSLPIPIPSSTTKKWSLEDESEEEDNTGNQTTAAIDMKKEPDSPPAKFQRLKKLQEDDEDENEKKKEKPKIKKLSKLDDDENDDKKPNKSQVDENDDIDPLDAYMQEVDKEVRNVNHIVAQPKKQQGVVILTGVAKKSTEKSNKGELIEQNMDSLEYSSEEELEDIKDTAANLANKHRKELAKIDHSAVNYTPFRKNFYVEVPELARMTQQEVDKYRADLEGIQVKGKGCPKPIKVKIFKTNLYTHKT